MVDKQVPTGVKVISVLYYIGAVFAFLSGLVLIFSASALSSIIPLLGTMGVIGGIVLMAVGVLGFFVGRGLWKGTNWARIVAIIFALLGVLMGIISMVQGNIMSNIISFLINLVIGWYLLFNSNVKEAFA